ncbi:hypothetical protein C8F01DRAFT_1125115, partial [Mycena amicta]
EYFYNPFAFDVGTLGIYLCGQFQTLTPTIPLLAPLLDGMVTRNVVARLSASDALAFFRRMRDEMSPEDRQSPCLERTYMEQSEYETYDRWNGLPVWFSERWGHMRAPLTIPLWTRVLRLICQYEWTASVLEFLRRGADGLMGRHYDLLSV